MASVNKKGNSIHTAGELPVPGSIAPDAVLAKKDLSDIRIHSLKGKKIILNIFPSIDTPVCAMSVRKFNAEAAKLADTAVLCISADLPFAHARFCGAEGIDNVDSLSSFRSDFGQSYGVTLADSAMKGLLARAVVVLDRNSTVCHVELVADIGSEPDYAAAIDAVNSIP